MNKKQILDRINEVIIEEKGHPVTLDGMFTDAQLDSLGTLVTFITLDAEYGIYNDVELEDLDITNLKIRDLVAQCILSNIDTSQLTNPGTDT